MLRSSRLSSPNAASLVLALAMIVPVTTVCTVSGSRMSASSASGAPGITRPLTESSSLRRAKAAPSSSVKRGSSASSASSTSLRARKSKNSSESVRPAADARYTSGAPVTFSNASA